MNRQTLWEAERPEGLALPWCRWLVRTLSSRVMEVSYDAAEEES